MSDQRLKYYARVFSFFKTSGPTQRQLVVRVLIIQGAAILSM